ncbi:MAG TPA: hypothetical protein VKU02_09315 [Gemmataceae bacterium]|nr:hypothetical protein [Gemmataceae bacterium]
MAGSDAASVPVRQGTDLVEKICSGEQCLAYIIKASFLPERTTFLTPPEYKQQVGYIVYPAGGQVQRHVHRPLERHLVGTSEVLVVRQGCCEVDLYNDDRQLVATRELREGDIMLMVGGGHGFRMLDDTVLVEVKQGPYTGIDEKERF